MKLDEVGRILAEVERQLAGVLSAEAEPVVQRLLNLVEQLVTEQRGLLAEVQRLRELLEQKKRSKTTAGEAEPPAGPSSDHSSEEQRRKREPPVERPATDRRTFKLLEVHEERECPVDPRELPPDAVRVADETVIVQDIRIEPHNIRFARHVYYSATEGRWIRGALSAGYDVGDFGPDLRSLIVALKYCGNMSEPKIRELLDNFQVQISSGSVSNILTGTAEAFADDYHAVFLAGLGSTTYQQTDDTSARVAGQFWHTHILCNPYYTFYATHPHKNRLTILAVLQNTRELRFRFDATTRQWLEQGELPRVWQERVAALGERTFSAAELQALLDVWFGAGQQPQARLDIEQAAAIVYYRHQTDVPVVTTLVCDDAGQFKHITDRMALCWIHAGRHYTRLSPVIASHADQAAKFQERFWDYYAALQHYRDGPGPAEAHRLRLEFEALFSTHTGYDALDDRIAKTKAKQTELLTVLSCPEVPLHNNASELGARVSARRRDVSLHSISARGVRAMDIFTTLVQTCKKLGVSAYAYLRDRLSQANQLPRLATLIPAAASG
jgi:Transposase IS66 family